MAIKRLTTDNTGWVNVFIDGLGSTPVYEYLLVDFETRKINASVSVKNGQTIKTPNGKSVLVTKDNRYDRAQDKLGQERDFFKILEGRFRGKNASILARSSGSWLENTGLMSPANLTFTIDEARGNDAYGVLQLPSKTVVAFTRRKNPVPAGRHVLQLPDEIHDKGRGYMSRCQRAMTWFRIGSSGDRYVHPGEGTLGCITVEPEGWNDVYWYLISSRKGDGVNVGMVEVINKLAS